MKNLAAMISAVMFVLLWLVLAVGPTVAVVWVAWHFISKFW